jgi:hypothetical protein
VQIGVVAFLLRQLGDLVEKIHAGHKVFSFPILADFTAIVH